MWKIRQEIHINDSKCKRSEKKTWTYSFLNSQNMYFSNFYYYKETKRSDSLRKASIHGAFKKHWLRFIINKERLDINKQELQSFRLAISRRKPSI